MPSIVKSVDVGVPVRTAYDQWTQFETFPNFMPGVRRVQQVTDTRTHWETEIAGTHREFDAEITEQRPDERVAWRSITGPRQAGVVTFHRLDDEHTRVHLQLDWEPEGFTELAASALGIVQRRVRNDLDRFREFIEARGGSTGGWRGEVQRPPQAGEQETSAAGGTAGGPSRAAGTEAAGEDPFGSSGPGPVTPPGSGPSDKPPGG
ncbi:hypothetical protein GCM10012275_04870 [Longimycelium tulufanense]|uniref:Coenzyme Q-binding protein COQ10 START domain-containing protein n=1 Tax=Longimycelium tulufanense TaxID=907463 RepID=A0A8J3C9T6_9PSEU|nr:SRPBCC family protein [Longimycelium tulufanense]GGM36739.1 hypothetical protein GCM10012275_04870 [Longimycelium tulufanense]